MRPSSPMTSCGRFDSPLDFVGINVYKPGWYIEPSEEPPGYRDIPINASHPKMKSARHVFVPEVM